MEELAERVRTLAANVKTTAALLDLPAKAAELASFRKHQETLATQLATGNVAKLQEELKTSALAIKRIERVLLPWEALIRDVEALTELITLTQADGAAEQLDKLDNAAGAGQDEELNELSANAEVLTKEYRKLELLSFFKTAEDERNAYLSINAGAGGTEACDWAGMLQRMYIRFCEEQNFKVTVVELLAAAQAGLKSTTLHVQGAYAYGYLQAEVGVHRLVRISPFDAGKRRHTSFASVAVAVEVDDAQEVTIVPGELRIDTFRASGAGGQHVNTTDSAVRLTHLPTGIVVSCQMERSQYQNKEQAFKVLRARLYERQRNELLAASKEAQLQQKKIEWGSQIRSYILHPYQLVKDHRTQHESGDVKRILDGRVADFIAAYLKTRAAA